MYRLSEGDLIALAAASTAPTRQQEVRVRYWLSRKGLDLKLRQSGWYAADNMGNHFGPVTLDQMEKWAKA